MAQAAAAKAAKAQAEAAKKEAKRSAKLEAKTAKVRDKAGRAATVPQASLPVYKYAYRVPSHAPVRRALGLV